MSVKVSQQRQTDESAYDTIHTRNWTLPPGHGTLKNILVLWVKYQAIKLTKGIRTASELSVGVEMGLWGGGWGWRVK